MLLGRWVTIQAVPHCAGRPNGNGHPPNWRCAKSRSPKTLVFFFKYFLAMLSTALKNDIESAIEAYGHSSLDRLVRMGGGSPYAIKFVASKWANHYSTPKPLKISESPALTWGTATYVTPMAFPLSSALYGRI